jgi:hypothetical protein
MGLEKQEDMQEGKPEKKPGTSSFSSILNSILGKNLIPFFFLIYLFLLFFSPERGVLGEEFELHSRGKV